MNRRAFDRSASGARRVARQVLRGCAVVVALAGHAQAQEAAPSAAPAPAAAPLPATSAVAPSPAAVAVTPAPQPQPPAPAPAPTVVYAAPPGYVLVPATEQPEQPRRRRRGARPAYTAGSPLPQGMLPPPVFRYTQGTAIPAGYHLESRANRGLIQGGIVTIALPYLASAIVGLSLNLKNGSSWLLLPVAGPWLTLGARRTRCGEIGDPTPTGPDCFGDEAGAALLITDGAIQLLGTLLVTWGALSTQDYAVLDGAKMRVLPLQFAQGGYGIGLRGSL